MYYTYLLQSKKDNKYYIGSSNDLKRRFLEHCNGQVNSTKHRRPLDLFYYEAYNHKKLATKRESNLKKRSSAYYGLLKRISTK